MNVHDYQLFCAVKNGDIDGIERLICELGANPNARADRHMDGLEAFDTPLIEAVRLSKPECMETLVRLGADVDRMKSNGRTALMEAALDGEHESLKALLRLGANAHLVDGELRNALALACWNSDKEGKKESCIRTLLSCGVDMHRKDEYKETALLALVSSECMDVGILDAIRQFEPEFVDRYLKWMIDFAERKGNSVSLDCLLAYRENCLLNGGISKGESCVDTLKF